MLTRTATGDALHAWLTDLELQGRSPETIRTYRHTLAPRLADVPTVAGLTPATVRRIMQDTLRLRPNSQRVVYAVLSSWGNWLVAQGLLAENPCARIPRPKRSVPMHRYLTEDQVAAVLDAASRSRRDAALLVTLVRTLYETGLRASELLSLAPDDLDHDRCVIHLRRGKGGKPRIVVASPETLVMLAALPATNGRLFPIKTVRGLELKIKGLGKRAGLPWLAPHDFRRSMATNWLGKGGDALSLQTLLGHAKADMTAHYARSQLANVAIDRARALPLLPSTDDTSARMEARLRALAASDEPPDWLQKEADE